MGTQGSVAGSDVWIWAWGSIAGGSVCGMAWVGSVCRSRMGGGGVSREGLCGGEVLRTFDGPLASTLCGGCVRSDESWLRPVGLWSGDMCVLWWVIGYVTRVIVASGSIPSGTDPCGGGGSVDM